MRAGLVSRQKALLLELLHCFLLRLQPARRRPFLVWIGIRLPLEVAASFLLDVRELILDGWAYRTIVLAAVLVAERVIVKFSPGAVGS